MHYIHIAGHIGKDPETRYTSDGQKVTTFSVATNIRRGGNDETIWWRVTIWGERFDKMLPYLTKGKPVMVGGDLARKPEIYTDKNGTPQVSSIDITADYVKFSPFGKPDQPGPGQGQEQRQTGYSAQQPAPQYGKNSYSDSGKKNKQNHQDEFLEEEGLDEEPLPF